jgi:predicted MFS family arabinose efflux permease
MSARRTVLPFTLVATMVASSFSIFALAVLAAELIDDLGISRGELGAIAAANTLIGAVTSPFVGRLTDRMGARRSVVVVLWISAGGMALMALAANWWMLVVSALVLGVPQGWGNPSTNSLISARVPPGRQGVLTGIKQSGVTLGVFLAGITLPGLAELTDWHGACWFYSALFAVFALVVIYMLPPDEPSEAGPGVISSGPEQPRVAPFVWRIAVYAFLLGSSSGAATRFLALFAHEELGMSVALAGLVVAVIGLLGMGTRVWAGRLAETTVEPARLLVWLAYAGVACSVTLASATTVGAWVMWPAALLFSIGFIAWNAVAMLAVIRTVTLEQAGRASGVVMLGFLGGHTVGAPAAGYTIDVAGTYQPVWWAAAVLSLAGAFLLTGSARAHRDGDRAGTYRPSTTVVE